MQRAESPAGVRTMGSEATNASHRTTARGREVGKASYRLFPSVEPTPPTSPQSLQKSTLQRASNYQKKRSISLDDTVRPHAARHNVHKHKQPTMKTAQRVQIPEPSQMSTLQESPAESPTIPIRYSIISKISDEQHYRSSSAPGDYIRDSQTLPVGKLSWASKQAESYQLPSPKGLGLSMPISRLSDVFSPPQSSLRAKPDLSVDTKYEDKPPPPPPKDSHHSRTPSAQSGVSSMHGESPTSTTLPTPGSIFEAAIVDAQASPVRMPPVLHAKQSSFASSNGDIRVREIVLTKDQTGQTKPVVLQPAIQMANKPSVPHTESSSNQSTPVLPNLKPATNSPLSGDPRAPPSTQHARNPSANTGKDQTSTEPTASLQLLKLTSPAPPPLKESLSDSVIPTQRTIESSDQKGSEARATKKSRLNLDKPMPSLPPSAGGFADHLREVREAEGRDKQRRPRMKPSPPTFPSFPETAAPNAPFAQPPARPASPSGEPPNAPFAQPPQRPGSPARKPDRFYSRAPSPSPYNMSNSSQRDLRSPTPDLGTRPQSPATANTANTASTRPWNTSRPVPDGLRSNPAYAMAESKFGAGARAPTPNSMSRPQSPPINTNSQPRNTARKPSLAGPVPAPSPIEQSNKITTQNGGSPTPKTSGRPQSPLSIDKPSNNERQEEQSTEATPSPPKVPEKRLIPDEVESEGGKAHSRQASKAESNATADGSGSKLMASILSRAHAQARTATPDTMATSTRSTDASAPDFDPINALHTISTQVEALHARYTQLRGDRLKLSTSISAALREQKPGPDYANVLLDQHLSLNAINSSMDICFAKLKALDCRKEDAIAALIARTTQKDVAEDATSVASVASNTPVLLPESGRATPEVEPKTLTPALFKPGKLSPLVPSSTTSAATTPDLAKEVSTVPPPEKRDVKNAAELEKRVTAIRDNQDSVEKTDSTDLPEPPMSPASAILSLDEESKAKRIRVKGAKAAKLLGLVAQATNGKPGSPGITLPDKFSLETMASSSQVAVDVQIQSKFSTAKSSTSSPTKTQEPAPIQPVAVPKRKPVASPRQGTNDSVSSSTTGESAAEEIEAHTPPQSPEQPFGLKSAKRGMVQTIQVFVDDDILDYYNGVSDRR